MLKHVTDLSPAGEAGFGYDGTNNIEQNAVRGDDSRLISVFV
jgi:hypothetical protein